LAILEAKRNLVRGGRQPLQAADHERVPRSNCKHVFARADVCIRR